MQNLTYLAVFEPSTDGSFFSFARNSSDSDSYFTPDGKTTNGYNQIHVVAFLDSLSTRQRLPDMSFISLVSV